MRVIKVFIGAPAQLDFAGRGLLLDDFAARIIDQHFSAVRSGVDGDNLLRPANDRGASREQGNEENTACDFNDGFHS